MLRNRFFEFSILLCLLPVMFMQGCAGGKTRAPQKEARSSSAKEVRTQTKTGDKGRMVKMYAGFDQLARQDYKLAMGAMANDQFSVAERLLKPLAEKYPKFSPIKTNLAIIYYNTQRVEEARTAFVEVTKQDKTDLVAYNYLGILHRQKGEFAKAMENYNKALSINPDYANALLNAGILYDLYLGDKDKALANYERYQKLTNGEDKEVKKWIIDLRRQM